MLWQIHNLSKKIEDRKTLKLCERCGLLHKKILADCPRCTGVDDTELVLLLKQRSKARVGLGKILYGVAIIFFLILIFN